MSIPTVKAAPAAKNGTPAIVKDIKTEPIPVNLKPQVSANGEALEDRILRINQLFELQGKYNRLQKSLALLNEFAMKKGDENIELDMTDKNKREHSFITSNPEVIKEVLVFIRSIIQTRIKAIEPLLKW